jgi:hypothetical protein
VFGVEGFRFVAIAVGGYGDVIGAEGVPDPYDGIRADRDHDDEK